MGSSGVPEQAPPQQRTTGHLTRTKNLNMMLVGFTWLGQKLNPLNPKPKISTPYRPFETRESTLKPKPRAPGSGIVMMIEGLRV